MKQLKVQLMENFHKFIETNVSYDVYDKVDNETAPYIAKDIKKVLGGEIDKYNYWMFSEALKKAYKRLSYQYFDSVLNGEEES